MYRAFFGLTDRPFGKTPNPVFLYESLRHREALARLEYAVDEKELALLTGPIGSGKTTLSRALIDRVGESRPIILLINPRVTPKQLLSAVATGLGLQPGRFRNEIVDQLHSRLYELHEEGREPVLIIDESQLIPEKSVFDEIRLLTNFQLDDQNLLSVILIGQPELERRLRRPAYEPLNQRIGIRYALDALTLDETRSYVEHRIRVAGGDRSPFTTEAVEVLFTLSRGVPRVINTLATTALLGAFGDDDRQVGAERVLDAGREHQIAGAL